MTTQPEVVKQSDLLNQLVLDRNTMEELGRVDVLWMHPPLHRVLGFICKSGFLGTKKTAFKLPQISTLGTNSILVNSKPTETDTEKVKQLESLINCEVWSDAGNKIGKIIDCLFNLQTGTITEYLLVSGGWSEITGNVYLLPPSQILSFGRKRVLVSESATKSFKVYRGGIKQKLTKARESLQEDYIQAAQELRSLAKQAQAATEQAKERAQMLAEQAREKAQKLKEQLQEETEALARQAQERSETLAEQVKERTQTIGEQVKEGTQSFTQQMQETLDPAFEEDLDTSPTSPPPANPVSPPTPLNNLSKAPDPLVPEDDDDEPWI